MPRLWADDLIFDRREAELKVPFKQQLSNGHVIDVGNNLIAGIVKKGPNSISLDFSYDNRNNQQVFMELGLAILNLINKIPNGILLIFSSYQLLEKCKKVWLDKGGIMGRLNDVKDIVYEPKTSKELDDTMTRYAQKARSKKGALLFAVCRGKVSEGYDFSDELARAVFVVGVPYPPAYEPKITSKKQYLDVFFQKSKQQMSKKING